MMPIRPYLAGRTFAPEVIVAMSAALEEACKALNVASDSSKRAMVAHTIILLVEEGRTPNDQLAATAVREIGGAKPT